ncbi:hypothetical protein ACH9L7_15560 [Haloferax sp. S1W]|uniref:hypothetical protein n=1 Tax=Haloferax sp. S1W TaxID=3377110 RepID=UPI0037C7521A
MLGGSKSSMNETTGQDNKSSDTESEVMSIEDAIRGFLNEYEYLHEFRLQKLLYIAEMINSVSKENRLTDAEFKPYMYGSYSEDLSDTLENLDESGEIPSEPDWQYGKTATKYLGTADQQAEHEIDHNNLFQEIREALKGVTSEDLGKWSKETFLYENTDFGSEMRFDRLDKDKAINDLEKISPKLKNVLENRL